MKIVNLTQHAASTEQMEEGAAEPRDKERVKALLTFEAIPSQEEMLERAKELAEIVEGEEAGFAMMGGAPYFMAPLEVALLRKGITPLYAFSRRETVEEEMPDGSSKKVAVFRHLGFLEAAHRAAEYQVGAYARLIQTIFQFPKGELESVTQQTDSRVRQILHTRLDDLAGYPRILRQIYGIGIAPMPMAAMARKWGTTPDRIRRIRDNAISRLQHPNRRGPLAVELQEAGMHFPGLEEAVSEHRKAEASAGVQPIDVLELSARTTRTLKADGIHTVDQLKERSEWDLMRIPGFGWKCLGEVREILRSTVER